MNELKNTKLDIETNNKIIYSNTNKLRIALDIDDVLAAFTKHCCSYHNKSVEKMNYWCSESMVNKFGEGWFEVMKTDEEFWATLPLLSKPEDIDFPVFRYISSFPNEMYNIRMKWLEDNGFPFAPLLCSTEKLKTCLNFGVNVLVDDKPQTIISLQNSPVRGIHFITPYAGFEPVGEYITNLKQLKQIL